MRSSLLGVCVRAFAPGVGPRRDAPVGSHFNTSSRKTKHARAPLSTGDMEHGCSLRTACRHISTTNLPYRTRSSFGLGNGRREGQKRDEDRRGGCSLASSSSTTMCSLGTSAQTPCAHEAKEVSNEHSRSIMRVATKRDEREEESIRTRAALPAARASTTIGKFREGKKKNIMRQAMQRRAKPSHGR